MDFDLQLMFRNMQEMKSIRQIFEKEVEKIDHKFTGIQSCRVTFDLPYHHRYPGNSYNFEIELETAAEKLIVRRSPSTCGDDVNVFAIIREAFDEMNIKLQMSTCKKNIVAVPLNQLTYKKYKTHPERFI